MSDKLSALESYVLLNLQERPAMQFFGRMGKATVKLIKKGLVERDLNAHDGYFVKLTQAGRDVLSS